MQKLPSPGEAGEADPSAKPRKEIELEKLLQLRLHPLLPEKLKEFGRVASLGDRIESLTHLLYIA